jgi:hypothetical protein
VYYLLSNSIASFFGCRISGFESMKAVCFTRCRCEPARYAEEG